jgi:hypothetical protein
LDSNDITLRAADRLEAALERLALALEARLAAPPPAAQGAAGGAAGGAAEDMVPRAEVAVLSARLDAALERLRALMGEDGGAGI